MAAPLPSPWRASLMRNVVLYARMPDALRRRLDGLINVFMAEKTFVGCGGLVIDDEVCVTIAAQACMLIVNRGHGCFDDVRTLLVYPRAFYVDQSAVDEYGLLHEERAELAGESWSEGQVVVSWNDARDGGRQAADGMNVVMHEFAHQLDGETGDVNGSPPLENAATHALWTKTMRREFDALRERVEHGVPSLIDPYGATDPAEFFAVATETFFERSSALREQHPDLYARLREVFRQDPAAWETAEPVI